MNGHFELGNVTPSRYFFSIAVVLGLLFALIAEDENVPFGINLLQWQLQSVLPMALLVLAHILLSRFDAFMRLNAWLRLLFSGLTGSTLFSPVALLVEIALDASPAVDISSGLAGEWLNVTPPVTICWIAINAPWLLGYRLQGPPLVAPGTEQLNLSPDSEGFMQQLDDSIRGQLLYLKAELHYLLVVTDKGKALLLYNLKDAIDELSGVAGMQVHRSWWVAADAVQSMQRNGRQGELALKGGQVVPVSRNRVRAVASWLEKIQCR